MENLLKELALIDTEIMNSVKSFDTEKCAKELADFANAQVFVGCGGCNGTQMCNSPVTQ